jgi:hypothetical protein
MEFPGDALVTGARLRSGRITPLDGGDTCPARTERQGGTVNTGDAIMVLTAAPATAYREYLYRPDSQLGRWIASWFDVVARPGQPFGQPSRPGDVLLQVTLGQPGPGRCIVLRAGDAEPVAGPGRLSAGQLLLRPRPRADTDASGLPAAGILTAGLPAAGLPAAGLPAAGTEALGSEDSGSPADVIPPFPGPISMPLEMTNQSFIDCIERAAKPADVTRMSAAVIDLSGDPALPAYAGHNDTDMLFVGSLAKLFAAYTAFELRGRVQRHAKKMISAGLSTTDPGWQGKVFTDLESAWQPQLDAAFPRPLPSGFPKLATILKLSPNGTAGFLENDPQLTFDELDKIGESGTPKGKFLDWMKLALGWSNNAAAARFISALSYPYINGVLGSAGFFDMASNTGLWVSGNFAGDDWRPSDLAGRPLSPRWQKPGHKVSNFTGTALQTARFLGLLAQGRLLDSQATSQLTGIMGVPFFREGLSKARPIRPVVSIRGKVGIGAWDRRLHDAAMVTVRPAIKTVSPAIKYVMAVLGSPPDRTGLDKLEVALHDCVVSRH